MIIQADHWNLTGKTQPFRTNLVNASYLIASSLPSSFEFPTAAAAAASSSPEGSSIPASRRVSIHVHPSPVPVAYSVVRATIPAILEDFAKTHGGRRPDLVIHMGIAATRSYYSVETQAHRDAYYVSDVKGKVAYEDGEKRWKELGLPTVLTPGPSTAADAAAVTSTASSTPTTSVSLPSQAIQSHPYPPDTHFLKTWETFMPADTDVRISTDAGRYLCEFIFYTSLAHAYLEGRSRSAVFFHVPSSCDDDDIEKGKQAALGLIKTLVTCWIDEKKK